jgi:hypothetical protein
MPLAGESLSQSITGAAPPDLKEVFNIGPPGLSPRQYADPDEAWAHSPNLWPHALPELQPAWTAYYNAMRELGNQLMSLFARGLGLPPGFFAGKTGHGANALRAINYPARDPAALPGQLRAGAHTGYGTVTIRSLALFSALMLISWKPPRGSTTSATQPGLTVTGLHALDGARYLRDALHPDTTLCRLVAHHSYAIVEAGERGLAGVLGLESEPAPHVLSAVLTYCDMTTSPAGELVPVERRLAEIHHRYGPGHLVSRSIQRATPMILRAVEHVHRRAARAAIALRTEEGQCLHGREARAGSPLRRGSSSGAGHSPRGPVTFDPGRSSSGGYPSIRERGRSPADSGGSRQKEAAGMLLDAPADTGLDAPARAGTMVRFARAVRTRWRTLFLLTGAVLTVLGIVLASGAVLLPGILLLLFALLHGIGSSGCTSADLLAGWPWRG